MNLLAVDATGESLSLALLSGGRVLKARRSGARSHDQALLPAAERLLARGGLGWKDLDAVAAAAGPGRFTGIRIGLAFASAAGFRLKIPALAVCRLEAAAVRSGLARVVAALPGWKGEVYHQAFRRGAEGWRPAGKAGWASAGDWPGVRAARERAGWSVFPADADAADLLEAARRRLETGRLPPFEPFYLKPAGYERAR